MYDWLLTIIRDTTRLLQAAMWDIISLYILRGYDTKLKGESFRSRGRNRTPYEHKFRTRASKYPELSCVAMSALEPASSFRYRRILTAHPSIRPEI